MAIARLNLRNVTTLLVDSDHFSRGLVAQMLKGFGTDPPTLGQSGAQAMHHLQHNYADLCIIEADLPDMTAAQVIRWIRGQENSPFRYVPIIVLSGYMQLREVSAARDAGANIVVKKPVSPQGLYDRISWVAKNPRPFVESATYTGPDRRFRNIIPPGGQYRRETDSEAMK